MFVCQSVCLCVCLVCLSVCQSVCLSVYICLSICRLLYQIPTPTNHSFPTHITQHTLLPESKPARHHSHNPSNKTTSTLTKTQQKPTKLTNEATRSPLRHITSARPRTSTTSRIHTNPRFPKQHAQYHIPVQTTKYGKVCKLAPPSRHFSASTYPHHYIQSQPSSRHSRRVSRDNRTATGSLTRQAWQDSSRAKTTTGRTATCHSLAPTSNATCVTHSPISAHCYTCSKS